MTTRWNAGDPNGVSSGYNGNDVPSDVHVPPCSIEDVDEALFLLLSKEINFQVSNAQRGVRKAHVFFGVGEKWASVKRNNKLRDQTGTLILPLISIRRSGIEQTASEDLVGRGMNQSSGEIVIKRRLSPKDRAYQNLLNSSGVPNQSNVPTSATGAPVGSLRQMADASPTISAPRGDRHIWEFITIPAPQFYTAKYEVTFWAQYTTDMNAMISKFMAAYLPQVTGVKLTTRAGYWFVAYVEGDFRAEDNVDDMNDKERFLKYTVELRVPAYTVAPNESGMQAPVRRFVSSPDVHFGVSLDDPQTGAIDEKEVPDADGADDPTLGYTLSGEMQPRSATTRQKFVPKITRSPFSKTERVAYVKTAPVNRKSGESVYRPVNGDVDFDVE